MTARTKLMPGQKGTKGLVAKYDDVLLCVRYRKMLEVVFEHTEQTWRRWMGRRCSKGYVSGGEFATFYRKMFPLPKPRIIHNNI